MPAQLLSLTEGPSLLLDKPILLIGRHEECDIQLNSRKVSRKHCCVAQVKDYLIVRDLASTNGIRINGVRVKEGVVRVGDELTIGNYRYQLHTELAPPPRPPAAEKRPGRVSDADIESSDEPVPLPEVSGIVPPARPARNDPPFGIPDNRHLAADSGSLHPPPAPS